MDDGFGHAPERGSDNVGHPYWCLRFELPYRDLILSLIRSFLVNRSRRRREGSCMRQWYRCSRWQGLVLAVEQRPCDPDGCRKSLVRSLRDPLNNFLERMGTSVEVADSNNNIVTPELLRRRRSEGIRIEPSDDTPLIDILYFHAKLAFNIWFY